MLMKQHSGIRRWIITKEEQLLKQMIEILVAGNQEKALKWKGKLPKSWNTLARTYDSDNAHRKVCLQTISRFREWVFTRIPCSKSSDISRLPTDTNDTNQTLHCGDLCKLKVDAISEKLRIVRCLMFYSKPPPVLIMQFVLFQALNFPLPPFN